MKVVWENPVFPVSPTEVPLGELTPLPTLSDRAGPGLCVKGGEVPAVGILSCQHHGGVSHHILTHVREDKALQLTQE